MKITFNIPTEPYRQRLCLISVTVAIVLAVLRVALTPLAFEIALPYGIVLGLTGVTVVALLVLSAVKHIPPVTVGGTMARVLAVAAAVLGAAMVTYIVAEFREWVLRQYTTSPFETVNKTDQVFSVLLIVSGLLSGALFLLLAVRWWRTGVTARCAFPLLSLAPVLWGWVRLVRYITSYTSTLGLFRNLYDLGMIVAEVLFFMLLARYISGVYEKDSRFLLGISLCTGLLCAISGIAQIAFFVTQNAAAFETCALVAAPDFGVALFAFAFAFAQVFGIPQDVEDTQESQPTEPVNTEDGDGAEFLLSDDWFNVYDPDKDD